MGETDRNTSICSSVFLRSKWSFLDLVLQREGGLCGNFHPWDHFPFSISLTFLLLLHLLPNLWGPWPLSLLLKFYFSLWRRTICPMVFCWYMSDLCQFSLSFCSSQSLSIPNRKISLLISSLVHPRNNHISPRVCVCVCVCVCVYVYVISIFLGDSQDLPSTRNHFYMFLYGFITPVCIPKQNNCCAHF